MSELEISYCLLWKTMGALLHVDPCPEGDFYLIILLNIIYNWCIAYTSLIVERMDMTWRQNKDVEYSFLNSI